MGLPPVYVIHCPEFPDRTAAAKKHFEDSGIRARWWRSVAGRDWGLETTREFDPGHHISPGHVGLLLGHWNLWNHLFHTLDRDDAHAIVCEDDVVLPPNFHAVAQDVVLELQYKFPEWDLVFLGLAEYVPNCWTKVTERVGGPTSRLCRMEWPWGTHCYAVRKKALPVLLDRMAVAERNADQQLYSRVLSKGLLQWCAVLPTLVQQRTHDNKREGAPEWSPSTVAPEELEEVRKKNESKGGGESVHQSPEVIEATLTAVDPFPCIYRGEFVEEVGYAGKKKVTLSTCALFNSSCHSRAGAEVKTGDGDMVVSCERCEKRIVITPQKIRDRLPLPEGHFNCSICWYQGKLILATRDSWGHSKVGLWELENTRADWSGEWKVKEIGSHGSDHPDAPRLEDPRLFVAPDQETGRPALHAALNLPDGYPPKRVKVGCVRFAADLSKIVHTEVFRSPHNNLYEKNWEPFWDGYEVRWVYSINPHTVLGPSGAWETPNLLPWTGGIMRGGCPPVRVDNDPHHGGKSVYYHFFHGVLKRAVGNVYTVGCYTFEAHPPFSVLKQTPTPLAWPDLPATAEEVVKRYVVFPGGAVLRGDFWYVAAGVDDTFCRIYRFGRDEVGKSLNDVPGGLGVMGSLQNSPVSRGVVG